MFKPNLDHAAFILAALLVLAGTASGEQPPCAVGVMLCLSGDCQEWGTNGLKGVELAAQELNQTGGILGRRVELRVEDSRDTSPANAVTAFLKLSREKPPLIIGPTWTVGGMPVAPLAEREKDLILISPSVGVKEFNEAAENIFNVWPHDEIATRALAAYAAASGWKKAAIFGSQDPFYMTQSAIFAAEFSRLGGTVVCRVDPLPASRDLKAEALKIKKSAPDFAMVTNYQADVIARELKAILFAAPVLALQMEKERVKEAGGALEGTIFAMYEKPAESFIGAFRGKFGEEPGLSADTAYDALKVYAAAVERAGTFDSAKVKKELLQTRDFRGASGTFSVDPMGAVDKKPVLWRVKGFDYEPVR